MDAAGVKCGGNNQARTGETMIACSRASLFGLICLASMAFGIAPSSAADYPNRPVRWIIGFPPGGPVDTVARIMSQALSERLGQQFVVENRAGSGGNIATEAAINATPDGYTLMFSGANNAISASLYKKLPFDFMRDTVPVALFTQVPNLLVVSNALPVKNVQELIDYCKANPGKLSYASSGNGTTLHMSAELFKAMTKCDMLHVPYRGSAAAFPDVISNKVQLIFDNLPTAMAQAKGGSVRALGVTSPQRWPSVPEIPTIAETVPGFEASVFYGMSAPKGTPPEIVDILNKAVNEVLGDTKVVERFATIGGVPKPMTPAGYGKLIADETAKWRKVVEFAGVSVE
jgi:tripartite-type tricarboxylate transporter receptor subunit TctC